MHHKPINLKNSTRDVHINPRIDHSMDIVIENDIIRANSSSYNFTSQKYRFYKVPAQKSDILKNINVYSYKNLYHKSWIHTVLDFCHFYVSKVRKNSIKLMGNNHYNNHY